ncbi:hypothetical protein SAMN05421858_0725 [Haladaptatus litoreus]|uniref:Roadblock/LAMTOR2 domain-containing protein n=1 Tax=Haladaptatus litoreus TaxID=553468 RepID=A0A1N6WHN3_9EURY|nr:hypothetical protein [Haladaptatus litoreus]SIQ89532.1 hypothetical protein SAMN05421858_0725 [Haladaptatus litoreus]
MNADELITELQDAVGDSLRTIAIGDADSETFSIAFMRDDIGALYSDSERQKIAHDLVLENLVEVRQEDLFEPLGDLQFTTRVFEHGINVIGWGGTRGAFIGLDPDETLIPTTIRACRTVFD